MLPQKCRIIKTSIVFVTNYIAFLKIYRVLSHTALFFSLVMAMEQLVLPNKSRFGRSSEKLSTEGKICFMEVDGTIVFFNEPFLFSHGR